MRSDLAVPLGQHTARVRQRPVVFQAASDTERFAGDLARSGMISADNEACSERETWKRAGHELSSCESQTQPVPRQRGVDPPGVDPNGVDPDGVDPKKCAAWRGVTGMRLFRDRNRR